MKRAALIIFAVFTFGVVLFLPRSLGITVKQRSRNIAIDLYCIQLDKSELDAIEDEIGFHLDPPDGKVLLTKAERTKLLNAIEKAESAQFLGREILISIPGCSCGRDKRRSEEVRYPTSYAPALADKGPGLAAREFETREIGLVTNFTITDGPRPGLITLTCFADMTTLMGWQKFGQDVSQPVFKSWNLSTRLIIPDGMTLVTKQIAPSEFNTSTVLPQNAETTPRRTKCCIFLLGVRKVKP